jgi:hypothetical protein
MRPLASLGLALAISLTGACGGPAGPTANPTLTPSHSPSVSPTLNQSPIPSPSSSPQAAVSPARSAAPSTTPGSVSIQLVGHEPVLRASELGDGHYGAVLTAAYTFYYGVHHAYLVGFGDARGDQRVFHARSADGVLWNIDDADPFENLGLDLSAPGPIPGTVLQGPEGDWLMYLWGVPSPQIEGSVLYRATSDSVGGPWVADPEPMLGLGEPGAWDDRGVDFPAVVPAEEGFAMGYSAIGYGNPESSSIGWAESEDGITWERASDAPVVEPALCGAEAADYAAGPRLLTTDDGYLLLFDSGRRTFAATSPDGVSWTCASETPLLGEDDIPGSIGIHTFAAADVDGRFSVLIESLREVEGVIGSDVWLGEVMGL